MLLNFIYSSHCFKGVLLSLDDDNRIALRPISGHKDSPNEYVNACYVDVSQ